MTVKSRAQPRTALPEGPRPAGKRPRMSRRMARRLRMPESRVEGLPLPARLLRHPSSVMFLVMREAYRLGPGRSQEQGSSAPEDMRFPHLAVLACLDEFGSASQKEISDRLRFDPSDLVGFVDWLEEAGLVRRRRDTRDRRRYALEITPVGRSALRRRDREAERFNRDELFAPLTDRERRMLRQLLLRVLDYHDPRGAPVP